MVNPATNVLSVAKPSTYPQIPRSFLLIANMTAGSPDPGDDVQPHPENTIETILKAMEKKSDNFKMDGQTRLKDIGFVKEDFAVLATYY